MIRTKLIYIEQHNVAAYRQKVPTGGFGVVVIDKNGTHVGVANINRKTGKPVNIKKNSDTIADEVFFSAAAATKSLEYYVLAPVNLSGVFAFPEEIPDDAVCLKESIVAQFDEFVAKFTDSDDNFAPEKMNINFMQFTARSKVVSQMINTEGCTVEEAVKCILKIKAAEIARIILPCKGYAEALIDMLNDLSGRDAFKELNELIALRLSKIQKQTSHGSKA